MVSSYSGVLTTGAITIYEQSQLYTSEHKLNCIFSEQLLYVKCHVYTYVKEPNHMSSIKDYWVIPLPYLILPFL